MQRTYVKRVERLSCTWLSPGKLIRISHGGKKIQWDNNKRVIKKKNEEEEEEEEEEAHTMKQSSNLSGIQKDTFLELFFFSFGEGGGVSKTGPG